MKRVLISLIVIFHISPDIHAVGIETTNVNLMDYALGFSHTYYIFERTSTDIFRESGLLQDDLPLVVTTAKNDTLPFAIIISGDGGWNNWSQSLAASLAQKGVASIGLDAQKYFWNKKTPEETAVEIAKIVRYYSTLWKKQKFILMGYSFGADVLPFIANRLPVDLKNKIEFITLLSPDKKADFEIHISDMLNLGNSKDKYNVIEELSKLFKIKTICIFGKGENLNTTSDFKKTSALIHVLPGDHHYNNNFTAITEVIMKYIN